MLEWPLSPGFESQKYLVPLNIFSGWVFPAYHDFNKIVRQIGGTDLARRGRGIRTCAYDMYVVLEAENPGWAAHIKHAASRSARFRK